MIAADFLDLEWTPVFLTVLGMVLVGVAIILLCFVWPRHGERPLLLNKAFFFTIGTIYLVALVAFMWLYLANFYGIKDAIPNLIGSVLPIGVPFFGAVGAVVISLEGVTVHFADWNKKWAYWHLSRPLLGAVLGSVAFFIYVLLAKAAGTTPPDATTPVSDLAVFFVIAFVVGYREETFRALVKAVVDVILKPANVAPPQAPAVLFEIAGAQVTSFVSPDVNVGAVHAVSVKIFNVGNASLTAPIAVVGSTGALDATFAKANDLVPAGDLAPGASANLDVQFQPSSLGTFSGSLTIVSGGNAIGSLMLSGRGI